MASAMASSMSLPTSVSKINFTGGRGGSARRRAGRTSRAKDASPRIAREDSPTRSMRHERISLVKSSFQRSAVSR